MLGPFSAGFTLDTYAHIMTAAPKGGGQNHREGADGGNLNGKKSY